MDAEAFVAALKEFAGEAAVASVLKTLRAPPGRRPGPELVELSKWFLALTPSDQDAVTRVVVEAARHTLFGVLAALDGARKIDDENGCYLLHHQSASGDIVLNGPGKPSLHELLYW